MPLPLTKDHLAERLKDYSRDNYLLLANVIKGVVLGSASFAAVGILSDFPHYWHEIGALLCSIAAAFVTYITWTRGVLLTNSRFNTRDVVLPLLMGAVEVSLFIVLYVDGPSKRGWHFWYLVLAAHALLAVLLVKNRLSNTYEEDFDETVRQFIYGNAPGIQESYIA